jgi:hypothetical protein
METNRILKEITAYKPTGKRSLERPLKRWHETIKGHIAR